MLSQVGVVFQVFFNRQPPESTVILLQSGVQLVADHVKEIFHVQVRPRELGVWADLTVCLIRVGSMMQVLDSIKRNLRQEQHVICEMNYNVMQGILSPVQV